MMLPKTMIGRVRPVFRVGYRAVVSPAHFAPAGGGARMHSWAELWNKTCWKRSCPDCQAPKCFGAADFASRFGLGGFECLRF